MQSVSKDSADAGQQAANDLSFMSLLNTQIRKETPAAINIQLKTVEGLPSNNGTIRCRVLGGASTPLSTQTKGGNTIE
ncbi:MAG: hypothetical protein GY830_03985 [Bacteroidetes bacterium]|nr:hypothetical protein [Bacteroidota bacterium]